MASPLKVLCLAVKNADPLFAMNVPFNRKRSTNAITFSRAARKSVVLVHCQSLHWDAGYVAACGPPRPFLSNAKPLSLTSRLRSPRDLRLGGQSYPPPQEECGRKASVATEN